MQQPNVTPQGWGQPQPPAPQAHHRGSFGRGLAIVALAIFGALVGMFMPAFLWAVATGADSPFGGVGLLVGAWLGLVAGIWVGVKVTVRR